MIKRTLHFSNYHYNYIEDNDRIPKNSCYQINDYTMELTQPMRSSIIWQKTCELKKCTILKWSFKTLS